MFKHLPKTTTRTLAIAVLTSAALLGCGSAPGTIDASDDGETPCSGGDGQSELASPNDSDDSTAVTVGVGGGDGIDAAGGAGGDDGDAGGDDGDAGGDDGDAGDGDGVGGGGAGAGGDDNATGGGDVGGDTPSLPFLSCKDILSAQPSSPDGIYPIDPDGAGPNAPFEVYCDMTSDGGGWILAATLSSLNTFNTPVAWPEWREDWWTLDHGTPTDPNVAFSNHDMRRFRTLIGSSAILRASNPDNDVKRYHFGFTPNDWDLWNKKRYALNQVRIIGPFNLANVQVSTSLNLSGAKTARLNGNWDQGMFHLGTIPGGGEIDSEGLGARFQVGSRIPGSYGYVGGARVDSRWHLWIRE